MHLFPNIIFCDSLEALKTLYEKGVSKDTKILTKAPALLALKNKNITNIEAHISNKDKEKLRQHFKGLTEKFYLNIKGCCNNEYTILLTTKFYFFLFDVYNGLLIKDEDIKNKFGLVELKAEDIEINEAIDNNIKSILLQNDNCVSIPIPVRVTKERSARGESIANIKNRLRIVGLKGLSWAILNFLSNFSFWNKKSKIGVLFYNELVRGVALKLLSNNKRVTIYKSPFSKPTIQDEKNTKDINTIKEYTNNIIDETLLIIKSDVVRNNLYIIWNQYIAEELFNYKYYIKQSEYFLKNKKNLSVLITGYINSTKAAALYKICKDKNITLVSCQHGVSRELIDDPMISSIKFETSFSDHFLCFNKLARKITEESKYFINTKKISIVGLPDDYFRVIKGNNLINKKPLLYVSTFLLSGGRPNSLAPNSDIEMVIWEKTLIHNILSKLTYNVDFKPYPALRYSDPDLVLSEVKKFNNLNIIGTHTDLRYMVSDYRIIITSGATSTISWCINAKKPIVFINRKGNLSLSKKALKDLSSILFVFDENDNNWQLDLLDFLNQPYRVIKTKWDLKENNRKKTIDHYFGPSLNIKHLNFNL